MPRSKSAHSPLDALRQRVAAETMKARDVPSPSPQPYPERQEIG